MAAVEIPVTKNYPLQLHAIKALFLHQQYRQCIQACRDLLKENRDAGAPHTVQQTFANFYLGLAHDELARSMHDHSQAKVPAFNQAAQCYKEALELLPAIGTGVPTEEVERDEDPFIDSSSPPATTSTSTSDDDEYDRFQFSTPSYPQMPPMSPPTHIRSDSLSTRSPQATSRETSSSDLDSHESFDQIMTPHKALQRDISKMSLLEGPPKRPGLNGSLLRTTSGALPRTTSGPLFVPQSTAQGLMKPIRPGSPPTNFFLPPRLPYIRSAATTSKLPKLVTHSHQEYLPSRKMQTYNRGRDPSPAPPSPVSPLGSEAGFSDASTISPISPETPVRDRDFVATAKPACFEHAGPVEEEEDALSIHVEAHVEALRAQLLTHLDMLEAAKERTISAQATRAAERASAAPTTGTPLTPFHASAGGAASSNSRPSSSSSSKHDSVLGASRHESIPATSKRMPQSRSYWSFTPQDIKAQELRKRVESGRKRGWAKERFRPESYRALAERALAEL